MPTELLPGLFRFDDTCNVYLLRRGDACLAVDFGSGAWLDELPGLGLPPVSHLFLTHSHTDQCEGLLRRERWPFVIHAPAGDQPLLSPEGVAEFWQTRRARGTPRSYAALPRGIDSIRFDMSGFGDCFIGSERIRFLHTPGHTATAVSLVVDHGRKQIVFCGDAAHAGATIWQPYHLEHDHWTGGGALAAWEGIERLRAVGMDLLCPAHGPVISEKPRAMLATLSKKLLAFYRAKGNICPGEKDRYLPPSFTASGAARLLPSLFQLGTNTYLLRSRSGEALVIDPTLSDMEKLGACLAEIGGPRVTAATATHCHFDHCDGLPELKRRHAAAVVLHPLVAAPLRDLRAIDAPWLPAEPIIPDIEMPSEGEWTWNEYTFRVAPFPGQTWWHCCLMAAVDGKRVFFGGDNFQANSRWNATGGFSSFNGSRFPAFAASAQRVIDWSPDWLCNGHRVFFRYKRSHFEKIKRWAAAAEEATRALCPSGDLGRDYYLHQQNAIVRGIG